MRTLDQFRKYFAKIANFSAAGPLPRFNCGDCERNAQCGLPPHDGCVERLTQIARDGTNSPRRPNFFYPAVWPQ
jgi:hypothetical protein